ncbi:Rare lipoprotein A precursor [hydrothermal vent metagenome]|uniref:Rare lipoprotein A n=1 Tax=hydrothermal vent metagenome TaxID=652676 RepID=A0A1W1BGA1_9ZZZZ
MNRVSLIFFIFTVLIALSGCSTRGEGAYASKRYKASFKKDQNFSNAPKAKKATMRPYIVRGKRYYPTVVSIGDTFKGRASWYGPNFHGKFTSNGERYNMYDFTAAHKTLPMNTILKVTNLNNGKSVRVRVNDRGPFVANRIIDLSKAAAKRIDMIATGTAPVKLEVIGFAGKNKMPTKKEIKNSPKSVAEGGFALQIGSFSNFDGAMRMQEKYDGIDGYHTIIKDMQNDYGRLYKVWLVGFKSEKEARDYKALGKFKHAFIVKED